MLHQKTVGLGAGATYSSQLRVAFLALCKIIRRLTFPALAWASAAFLQRNSFAFQSEKTVWSPFAKPSGQSDAWPVVTAGDLWAPTWGCGLPTLS